MEPRSSWGKTPGMSKLAAEKRASRLAEFAKLTPDKRVTLALALGRREVEPLCRAEGIPKEEARRRFRASAPSASAVVNHASFLGPDAKP